MESVEASEGSDGGAVGQQAADGDGGQAFDMSIGDDDPAERDFFPSRKSVYILMI